MLCGTGQSGTRDPEPGTHWVPENIAIQSGTRDLGPRVPVSIVVPMAQHIIVYSMLLRQHATTWRWPHLFYMNLGFFFNCERVLKMLIQRDVFFLSCHCNSNRSNWWFFAVLLESSPFELLWPQFLWEPRWISISDEPTVPKLLIRNQVVIHT